MQSAHPKLYMGNLTLSSLITNFLLFFIAFLVPIQAILIATSVLVFFDFITGCWKSLSKGGWKNSKGDLTLSSRAMSHTITKSTLYIIAILTFHLTEIYLVPEFPLTRIIAGFIGVTELKSISENISIILKVNLWVYVKELLNRKKNDS